MKNILLIAFSLSTIFVAAQNTIDINNVTISSSFSLLNDLDLYKKKNEHTDEIKGFRIQIISDNNRSKVYEQKSKVYQHFSEYKSYLKYVQPYYKLRIGDFKTKLEARAYLERVIKVFPSAFIVFDDIKLR